MNEDPEVAAAAHAAIADHNWPTLRLLLHPYLHWTDADGRVVHGRTKALEMLQDADPPAPPSTVELRDGQVYRWTA